MKKYLTAATAGLIMSAAVALCAAPSALAHDRVNWSVRVGSEIRVGPCIAEDGCVLVATADHIVAVE